MTLSPEQQSALEQSEASIRREFEATHSPETVGRLLADTRRELESRGVGGASLPTLIERLARARLRSLGRIEGTLDRDKPAVVFLCVHNAGRSQMAAGWARHLAGDGIEIFSGGSNPGDRVNPAAVAAMAEAGVDISRQLPQPWTDEIVRAADVVVTMGCGDACPVFPGVRYEDWELMDPAGLPVEQVRPVRDEIRARVQDLLTRLGVAARRP